MRVTGPFLKVIGLFLGADGEPLYGLEIVRESGLKSGTVYPLLERLAHDGWVERWFEDDEVSASGGPRRRFYRLTGLGTHEAHQALIEYGGGAAVRA